MGLLVRGLVALALIMGATPVWAECQHWPVDPSISLDGRSVLATPRGFGRAVPFFIANAHLPNPDSECRFEELRAVATRAVIVKVLSVARVVAFCVVAETSDGFLARIDVDGRDLADMLAGLGLAYRGEALPIAHWCRSRAQGG
jgi:hypothetical protein